MHLAYDDNRTFTTLELERLAVYKAAVAAGFYTDWYPEPASAQANERSDAPKPRTRAVRKPRRPAVSRAA